MSKNTHTLFSSFININRAFIRVSTSLVLVCLVLGSIGCSEDPVVFTELEMVSHFMKIDPTAKLVNENPFKIDCEIFKDGCQQVYLVAFAKHEIVVVQFSNEEQARKAAMIRKTLSARNWLFENVMDEQFIQEALLNNFPEIQQPTAPATE